MSQRPSSSISNLVAEQPGLLIVSLGVIVSVLIGLTLRALTREDVLKSKLDTLLAGTGVQYERVYFRLAHGWWPDFSVIINQVHYEKQDACVLSPSIDAHEVRIPFSVISLLLGEVEIEKIEIDSAVALLRADLRDCHHEGTASTSPASSVVQLLAGAAKDAGSSSIRKPAEASSAGEKANEPPKGASAEVETRFNTRLPPLVIDQLRVNYLPQAFASADFKNLELRLNQMKPLKFTLDSAIEASAEFAARSQLRIDYDETLARTMVLKLDGIWREGRFTLDSYAEKKTSQYGLEFQAKQIPLSQLVPILKRYGVINSEFNGKQAWISFTINSEGAWTHMARSLWKISKVQLEGDLGEVTAERMTFTSLEPLQAEPFDLNIEKLDIDQLLKFLGRADPSPTLLSLGVLQGQLRVESPRAMQFAGKLQGLQLIFANKGSREIMPIQSAEIDLALAHESWKGTISNIKLADNGEFIGSINLKVPAAGDSLQISTQFEKLKLQKSIGNLLSNGGVFPEWKGAVTVDFHKGQLISIAGDLFGDQGVIESIELTHPKVRFYPLPTQIELDGAKILPIEFDVELENASIPAATSTGQYLQKVITPHEGEGEGGKTFDVYGIKGKFLTEALRNFSWKSFEFQTPHEKFRVHGGWDEKDELYGELSDTDIESKRQVVWTIKGSRDQPELVLKDSSKN